jgi:hypothetical protein
MPVRVKKTRKNKKLEPRSDSIGSEKALERFPAKWMPVRVKKTRQGDIMAHSRVPTEDENASNGGGVKPPRRLFC